MSAAGGHARTFHGVGHRDPKNRLERRTEKILRNMPSRASGPGQVAAINSKVSQASPAGTLSRRRSSAFGTIRLRGGLQEPEKEKETVDQIAEIIQSQHKDLDKPEEQLKVRRELRDMKAPLTVKRSVREKVLHAKRLRRTESFWTDWSNSWRKTKRRIGERVEAVTSTLSFGQSAISRVAGVHGSSVAAFFQFLRSMFYLNLLAFVVLLGFVVIPQWLWRFSVRGKPYYRSNVSFTGGELLTGAGWFQDTELYYGAYTNESIQLNIHTAAYDMPLAYFFGIWGSYVLVLIVILWSFLRQYRLNFIDAGTDVKQVFVNHVLGGWDHQINTLTAAERKQHMLFNDFKELLAGREEKELTFQEKARLWAMRLGLTLVMILLLVIAGFCVYLVSDLSSANKNTTSALSKAFNIPANRDKLDDINILNEIALALTITGINHIFPYSLSFLTSMQNYQPQTELYLTLFSDLLLKITTLVTLFYFLLPTGASLSSAQCWESHLGSQIYTLVVMDFLFLLLVTVPLEFLRWLLATVVKSKHRALQKPTFNIARSTVHVLFGQALAWLGAFYAPMLLFLAWMKFLLIFYIRWLSSIYLCQPPNRPWRAARAQTVFQLVMLILFLISVGCVAFACFTAAPSADCGPLREYDTSYGVLTELLDSWTNRGSSWVVILVDVLTSQGAILSIFFLFCVVLYWQYQRAASWRELVFRMQDQVKLENNDKKYLYKILHDMLELELRMEDEEKKAAASTLQPLAEAPEPPQEEGQIYRD